MANSSATLSVFDLVAILLILTAAFAWINHRLIRLPHTIGLLVMGLVASLVLIGVELVFPNVLRYEDLAGIIRQIDFQATVLNGMLAFLLFAGALHVNLSVLRDRAWAVGSMATVGICDIDGNCRGRLLACSGCSWGSDAHRVGAGFRRAHQPD